MIHSRNSTILRNPHVLNLLFWSVTAMILASLLDSKLGDSSGKYEEEVIGVDVKCLGFLDVLMLPVFLLDPTHGHFCRRILHPQLSSSPDHCY